MSFDITPLLLHSDDVPVEAKEALRAASGAPLGRREMLLADAAREIYWKTELECGEARDLVGLPAGVCG